jgi:hypothetical protein
MRGTVVLTRVLLLTVGTHVSHKGTRSTHSSAVRADSSSGALGVSIAARTREIAEVGMAAKGTCKWECASGVGLSGNVPSGNAQVGMAENELASGYFEYSHDCNMGYHVGYRA